MTKPVIHFTLDAGDMLTSTYCSTLGEPKGQDVIDHPGSFSARPLEAGRLLRVALYHGRDTEDEDMDDWGYVGPTFQCQSVAHDTDVLLLQDADAHSLALAQRLGLTTRQDTITVAYGRDGVLAVPRFRGDQPAFFGDFSIRL